MNGLVSGLWKVCSALKPVGAVVAVVMLAICGIVYIKDGADGKAKIKENIIAILIGLAICLLAPTIGQEVAKWFGYTVTIPQ